MRVVSRILILLALPALAASARRADAQLGMGPGKTGVRVSLRLLGERWQEDSGTGWDHVTAGVAGGGKAIDGFRLKLDKGKLEYKALVADADAPPWKKEGEDAGVAGTPLGGLAIRVDQGSVRYRVSFVKAGWSEWAEDGVPVGRAGQGLAVEAIEIDYRNIAKAGANIEYRVAFAGTGFTPWLKGGQSAEVKGIAAEMMALEIRGGGDIRYELSVNGRGWLPTAIEGETAGNPANPPGKRRVEAIRLFGGRTPLRYRVKLEGLGWTSWATDGEECGATGQSLRIEGVQIEPDRGAGAKASPPPKK